jgi:hypothetical protein
MINNCKVKIGFLWNGVLGISEHSVKAYNYIAPFIEQGFECVTFCRDGLQGNYPFPIVLFRTSDELLKQKFWIKNKVDLLIIPTWHRMNDILAAVKNANIKILALGESDGQVSVYFHKWQTFMRLVYMQVGFINKIRASRQWLFKFIFKSRVENDYLINNIELSDFLFLGNTKSVEMLKNFMDLNDRGDLNHKIKFLPYPIDCRFNSVPDYERKKNYILAVGRWESPQKNYKLLERVVMKFLKRNRLWSFIVCGSNCKNIFYNLGNNPRVELHDSLNLSEMYNVMEKCKILLNTSRWEGSPVSINEMLAMGGSIVGPPIPCIESLIHNYPNIPNVCSVAKSYSKEALVEALERAVFGWENNLYCPKAIRDYWFSKVSQKDVMLKLIDYSIRGLS